MSATGTQISAHAVVRYRRVKAAGGIGGSGG
jgi:hypothetical protein